jgi:hypothetical protein
MSEIEMIGGSPEMGSMHHEDIAKLLERRSDRLERNGADMWKGSTPNTSIVPTFVLSRAVNVLPDTQTEVE